MRTLFFFLTIAAAVLTACRGSEEETQQHSAAQLSSSGSRNFYKRYSGTIGGKAVVVQLHRMGGYVGGSYCYVASGIPIGLFNWGDTVNDDTFELTEYNSSAPVSETPWLRLVLSGNRMTGRWTSGDSSRSLDVVLREEYPAGSTRLAVAYFEDSARMFPGKPAPLARASYGSVVAGSRNEQWIDAQIKKVFGEAAIGSSSWPQAFRELAGDYFADYRNGSSGIDSNDIEALGSAMYNYSTEYRVLVLMNSAGWLILENKIFDYTGGAHGNHGSFFLNLDVKAQRTWKLTDVVADTAALAPFLAGAAISRFGLSPEEPLSNRLLVDAVPVTDNFYLTAAGLGFVYNPYEIASYADGEVHLFVPYKRLGLLLTETFKQRMGLTNAAVMRG